MQFVVFGVEAELPPLDERRGGAERGLRGRRRRRAVRAAAHPAQPARQLQVDPEVQERRLMTPYALVSAVLQIHSHVALRVKPAIIGAENKSSLC